MYRALLLTFIALLGCDDGDATCTAPAGSPFTFHLHNGGTQDLTLPLGRCGEHPPFLLAASDGLAQLQAPGYGSCESLASIDEGYTSDCGSVETKPFPAGATVDFPWNHVGRIEGPVPTGCGGATFGATCFHAVPMPGAATQRGWLTVCNSTATTDDGLCVYSDGFSVFFTVDTTKSEATIEVE